MKRLWDWLLTGLLLVVCLCVTLILSPILLKEFSVSDRINKCIARKIKASLETGQYDGRNCVHCKDEKFCNVIGSRLDELPYHSNPFIVTEAAKKFVEFWGA